MRGQLTLEDKRSGELNPSGHRGAPKSAHHSLAGHEWHYSITLCSRAMKQRDSLLRKPLKSLLFVHTIRGTPTTYSAAVPQKGQINTWLSWQHSTRRAISDHPAASTKDDWHSHRHRGDGGFYGAVAGSRTSDDGSTEGGLRNYNHQRRRPS